MRDPADFSDSTSSTATAVPALAQLREAATVDGHLPVAATSDHRLENQLVRSRLGSAAGLYVALRHKHASSAAHSLRVAIAASGWAAKRSMSTAERDLMEVAALLHDIGKLSVPDAVLLKPGRLEPPEAQLMSQHRLMAAEILSAAGAPVEVIDTIITATASFDGCDRAMPLAGEQIPLPARMLAILDAWDSMTTDHVWRPAKSRERALAELFECAGRQFDPALVREFGDLVTTDTALLERGMASRWLNRLREHEPNWEPRPIKSGSAQAIESLFEHKLIANMHDGVVFVDAMCRIMRWNTGCERMTGVAAGAAHGKHWRPSLLTMHDAEGEVVPDEACPVAMAIATCTQQLLRVEVTGRSGRRVKVDLQAIPVVDDHGVAQGATVLLQDASSEATLEERCQSLHAATTRDPMTQVANRAEFDRMLALFVDAHQDTGLPCSLIMADIDHFKNINDTFGHQAGDEAIITFAQLLKSMCRSGDLVARYGGEEFAVLCADCNNAAAAARAEQMRKKLSELTHSHLANHSFTASFGVSELQTGDLPETLLRRADRALLQAKEQGRNQVVQLGDTMAEEPVKRRWSWFKITTSRTLIETKLLTNVPVDIAIEKLRGFIADHAARVLKVTDDQIRIELSDSKPAKGQRSIPFQVELKFAQQHVERKNTAGLAAGKYVETTADVRIRPKNGRDLRNGTAATRARLLLGSLKSYLMAREVSEAT